MMVLGASSPDGFLYLSRDVFFGWPSRRVTNARFAFPRCLVTLWMSLILRLVPARALFHHPWSVPGLTGVYLRTPLASKNLQFLQIHHL